jgi:hypothetical protein
VGASEKEHMGAEVKKRKSKRGKLIKYNVCVYGKNKIKI